VWSFSIAVVALIRSLMVRAVQVAWSSGVIQEMMLQACWHGQIRLQEYVKKFVFYSVGSVYVQFLFMDISVLDTLPVIRPTV